MRTPALILASAPAAAAQPKKSQKVKKPRAKSTHPKTAEMVNGAIKCLRERGGSSLHAIKKYISSVYKVNGEGHAPFIKRYLKTAVAGGILVQAKGKGAAGSFKLAAAEGPKGRKPSPAPLKKVVKVSASPKKSAAKKSPKKTTVRKAPAKNVIKGPAAKPPKVKTTAKVKAAAKPAKKPAKQGKVAKAKRPVKKTARRKK
ncbi:histone H1B [Diachasma alloeum]|uniref:histone H1B n=1 Tax=Diachasma alloeum TaxID=454923 RepID=UPI00073826B1|nr:histone H1B [Diachasma alloeum]